MMPEGEESHSPDDDGAAEPKPARFGLVAAALIVVEVLLAGALAGAVLLPGPAREPAPVITFPTTDQPVPDATSFTTRVPTRAQIRTCLRPALKSGAFGPRLAVDVGTTSGQSLFAAGPARVTPASTIKLFTATAALGALGSQSRFATSVERSADGGTLVLVGGGDPLLARASSDASVPGAATLQRLAARTAARLGGSAAPLRLVVDASLFTGPAVNPAWEPGYVPDNVVSPISALWVDEGRVAPGSFRRSPDPARAAGRDFARLLRKEGVRVRWSGSASVPARSVPVASVRSPALVDIVRHVLLVSDNEGAEVLARHVALALDEPPSFAGASRAVPGFLAGLGVHVAGLRMLDGSGLSRADRVPVPTYLSLLDAVVATPSLRPVLTDLPVSGFDGTLGYRYDEQPKVAHGTVHAKTGTLTGVHALAGYVVSRSGAPLLFVAVADRVPVVDTVAARDGLAAISGALAGCGG